MTVFSVPAQAKTERACFSVLDGTHAEELMLVPEGAAHIEPFAGWTFFYEKAAAMRVPIHGQTLVPEAFGAQFAENPVWVSARIAEGVLEEYLAEKLRKYGARLWVLLEPYRHAMALPCRDLQLTEEAADASRVSFFSEDFCCYCYIDDRLHLFDTPETVLRKKALCERIGVSHLVIFP